MSDENLPIEQQLVRDALMFEELKTLDTKLTPTTPTPRGTMVTVAR